jgi:hypothetical protein
MNRFNYVSLCQKSPIVGVASRLREIDDIAAVIPLSEIKGSPMGYPFLIDMRNVTHYVSP